MSVFNGTQVKTIAFLIVDIILMFLFAWFWFKYIHPDTGPVDPAKESFRYTFWMTAFFGLYYYTFESWWDHFKPYLTSQ